MTKKNRVVLAVTNDLATDQRVHRVATTLLRMGANVTLIGRKLKQSLELTRRDYKTKRFKLIFSKGPLFYILFNIRLFIFLIFKKVNVIVSNDLDTLPGCFLAGKIKKVKLVFDSHELFTEVPELQGRMFKQKIWKKTESYIVPKIKYAYTVCDSIASIMQKEYQTKFTTIRNLPFKKKLYTGITDIELPKDKFIILYQGSLNEGRGLEKTIHAMKYINNAIFVIIGRGDIEEKLKNLVIEEGLDKKIIFTGVVPYEKLHKYTCLANLGISLEENLGLNYYYALPNKIFDYIQANVPVLASSFPEMKKIVDRYEIGSTTNEEDPEKLAGEINQIIKNKKLVNFWKRNLEKASNELNWEKEEKELIKFYEIVFN